MNLYKIFKNSRNSADINIDDLRKIIGTNVGALLIDVRSPQEYVEGHLERSS